MFTAISDAAVLLHEASKLRLAAAAAISSALEGKMDVLANNGGGRTVPGPEA